MSSIDVGPGAVDRASTISGGNTIIDLANPANASGTLDSFEIWASSNLSSVKMGTFSGSGSSYDDRDYESIGSVTSGSKQTFTGKNCDVVTGDYLGSYHSSGNLRRATSGGSGIYYKAADTFGGGANNYSALANNVISIYATAPDPPSSNIGACLGVAYASIGKIMGLAIASVGKIIGLACAFITERRAAGHNNARSLRA